MEIRLSHDEVCELNFQFRYDKAKYCLSNGRKLEALAWAQLARRQAEDVDDLELRQTLIGKASVLEWTR